MDFIALSLRLTLMMVAGMLVCLEIGYRVGQRRFSRQNESEKSGISIIDASIFGLLGLILAFTFGGVVSRLDHRRQLIVEEANAIETAYLRLSILASPAGDALRVQLKDYLDSRIGAYALLPDTKAALVELARGNRMQKEIWENAVEAAKMASPQPVAVLLLPALNQMFDVATKRTRAAFSHVPMPIIYLLMATAWFCSILAGYSLYNPKGRNILHMLIFAAMISVTFYAILDLEYPRLGLINLRDADQVLINLRASFN